VAFVAVVLGVAGCGAPAGSDEVTRTAREWEAAAAAGDAGRLCALLSPTAAESVAAGDETCSQAVGDLRLPGDASVGTVQLWGDRAQVRAGTDTLFLVRLAVGWRVSGAGCTPNGDRPYTCDVEG
jgi:hypothetical protein